MTLRVLLGLLAAFTALLVLSVGVATLEDDRAADHSSARGGVAPEPVAFHASEAASPGPPPSTGTPVPAGTEEAAAAVGSGDEKRHVARAHVTLPAIDVPDAIADASGWTPPPEPVASTAVKPVTGPSYPILRILPGQTVALAESPEGEVLTELEPRTEFGSPHTLGVVSREGAWFSVVSPMLPNNDAAWVLYDPSKLELYWTRYSLHADLSDRTLDMRYGKRILGSFIVSVGAEGTDTPEGRFAITDALVFDESSYYGCCALALSGHQPNLPAGWLGGDRIAIHGTQGGVGGADSAGCLRGTEATMRVLFESVPLGAPVLIEE